MKAPTEVEEPGCARFTFRLRVSSTALAGLSAEWARCRWLWNECCARSKKARAENEECGPARLDRMVTEARKHNPWLSDGSSVPQQQLIRDFGKSRAKAFLTVVWSRALPAAPSSVRIYRDSLGHWYASFVVPAEIRPLPATGAVIGIDWGVVHPSHTTMDCGRCGARAKHALPLSERTYTCTACGAVSPRDKNSARVMLLRAGLDPAGADRGRPAGPPGCQAA
ncbi:zinc ribbon domain-containing protein [Streptomyces sp. DSM 116496]|uniref:zinc ribbon domain-containing protein n=1 Tax=Streptomyces stoeckheimensis TaxID=3344656 RepID=UPI0038B40E73